MPFAFLASFRPQRQLIRFTGEIWVIFFCQALGAPIPLLRAHAVARTQCACQNFVLDQYGDHVLCCKKHTRAIAGHDHVMNVSAQLACNRDCENVSTASSPLLQLVTTNKVMYRPWSLAFQDMMIWYGMCLSSVIGSAAARSVASMVSCYSVTTLTLGLAARSEDTDVITLSRTSLSHLRAYLSLAQFTLNFYVSCE